MMKFRIMPRVYVATFKWRADKNDVRVIGAPCCIHLFVNWKDFMFGGSERQRRNRYVGGETESECC